MPRCSQSFVLSARPGRLSPPGCHQPDGVGDWRTARGGWAAPVVVTSGSCRHAGSQRAQDGGVRLQHRSRPHFCGFFPQSRMEAARGKGPQVLIVQNPLGGGSAEGSCLPGAVAGDLGTSWSRTLERAHSHRVRDEGTEEPSLECGCGEGRRDDFGQKQSTILVHQLLTKGGGGTTFSSGGFVSCFATCPPRRGPTSRRAVGSRTGAPRKPFCFVEVP